MLLSITLTGCYSKPAALDPRVASTGETLSAMAQTTDVIFYDLQLTVLPSNKQISGTGKTMFRVLKQTQQVELKIDSRFSIEHVTVAKQAANFSHQHGVIIIDLYETKYPGEVVEVAISY